MKRIIALLVALSFSPLIVSAQEKVLGMKKYEEAKVVKQELQLTTEWDKTFPKGSNIEHRKVTFVNRYGITLAADMYVPKGADAKLPALAVCGPFGAVKEQSSGLYAQQMAERGFLTIAFDPSFTGESGGQPRYMASPDINSEDFSAAVDFLSIQDNVDAERIGLIGICGWGGIALNAASNDPRIKATVASTMYDMTRVSQDGYFDQGTADQRYELRKTLARQRIEDYKRGLYTLGGGVVEEKTEDLPWFVKDYFDYYKTKRGYHPRSLNSNGGWNKIGGLSMLSFPMLYMASEIRNAVMILHGDKAHSFYMGKTAYSKLSGDNKELLVVHGASHTDLYDQLDKIPFDRLAEFFSKNMK